MPEVILLMLLCFQATKIELVTNGLHEDKTNLVKDSTATCADGKICVKVQGNVS